MNLFLTFPGNAADALKFYQSVFPDATASETVYYPDGKKILNVQLTMKGQSIMLMDLDDCPPFSWSTSIYVETGSEDEFQVLLNGLKEGGAVLMGPEPAGKMAKVSWVTDKFGLTWQLAWEGNDTCTTF